jgi:hypothetical protein
MRDVDQIIKALLDEGRLTVDFETGHVYSAKSNTPAKPLGAKTAKGYLRTCINYNGDQVYVMLHRVVWIAAHGIPPKGFQIDHRSGVKSDNSLSNLEAVPGLENMRRAARNGLTNGGWRDAPRDPVTGRFIGKAHAGRLLDGREHNDMPRPAHA